MFSAYSILKGRYNLNAVITIKNKTDKNYVSGVVRSALTATIVYDDDKTTTYSNNTSLPFASFLAKVLGYFTQDAKQNAYEDVNLTIDLGGATLNDATMGYLMDWFTNDTEFSTIKFE